MLKPTVYLSRDGSGTKSLILIRFEYSRELAGIVRELGGRWRPDKKAWSVAWSKEKIAEIHRYPLLISDGLLFLTTYNTLGTNNRVKIFQLITILFLINFSAKSQERLNDNSTIKTVFNEIEIKDLETILNFFDNKICETENINKSNILECYSSFFERMAKSENAGSIEFRIPFNEQENIYKLINQTTFDEIWIFGKNWKRETNQTFKYLSYNLNGKYVKFLEKLGIENKVIKTYIESLYAAGDISPSMFANVLMGYKNYDITNSQIRLMIAIHYLTLNDQNNRTDKY